MVFGCVTCSPNEALVISGCCHTRPKIVRSGMAFVLPVIHRVQRISLNNISLEVESRKALTNQGVVISLIGVAQVKIQSQTEELLLTACQGLIGKTEKEIRDIVSETLDGHQRSIIGSKNIEDIFKQQKKFSTAVFEMASTDLSHLGITVVSYTIKDLRDEEGYLKVLKEVEAVKGKRFARIGEDHKDSLIKI